MTPGDLQAGAAAALVLLMAANLYLTATTRAAVAELRALVAERMATARKECEEHFATQRQVSDQEARILKLE